MSMRALYLFSFHFTVNRDLRFLGLLGLASPHAFTAMISKVVERFLNHLTLSPQFGAERVLLSQEVFSLDCRVIGIPARECALSAWSYSSHETTCVHAPA